MTIETKCDIGDEVHFLDGDRFVTAKVHAIRIVSSDPILIKYQFKNYTERFESDIFKRGGKEELLKSL